MRNSYYLNIFALHDCILLFKQTHSCATPRHLLLNETSECVFNDTDNLRSWQARPLWRRTLRYWGWLRRTAREPACTRPPQVCVCVRTIHSNCFSNALFDCTCSAADTAINQAAPLNLCFCVCVCVLCKQRCGKSVSLRCFCQRKRRSLWRRWKATGRRSLRKSERIITSDNTLSFTLHWQARLCL